MKSEIKKLLSIGGAPLGSGAGIDDVAGLLGTGLAELLARKDGFYAFESALHVFPIAPIYGEMSLRDWNEPSLWRSEYGDAVSNCTFFAEDVFGGQFAVEDGNFFSFDPETGEMEELATSFKGFVHQLLADYEVLTGHPIAHAWQLRYGALPPGSRLVPRRPFVLGGDFEVDNLVKLESVQGMKVRGNLARQIKDLPDGTRIVYKIVD